MRSGSRGCRLTGDVLNLLLFVLISRTFGPDGAGAELLLWILRGHVRLRDRLPRHRRIRAAAILPAWTRLGGRRFLAELLGTQVLMVGARRCSRWSVYLAATAPTPATLLTVCVPRASIRSPHRSWPRCSHLAMAAQRMLWPALAELTAGHRLLHRRLRHRRRPTPRWRTRCSATPSPPGLADRRAHGAAPASRRGCACASRSHGARRIAEHPLVLRAARGVRPAVLARRRDQSLKLTVGDAAAGVFATGLRLIEVALMPLSFLGVAAYPRLSQLFAADLPAFRQSAVDLAWLMMLGGGLAGLGSLLRGAAALGAHPRRAFCGRRDLDSDHGGVRARAGHRGIASGACCCAPTGRSRMPRSSRSGPCFSLLLNLWWVPPLRHRRRDLRRNGRLCRVIDVLCVVSLRQAMTARRARPRPRRAHRDRGRRRRGHARSARWGLPAMIQAGAALPSSPARAPSPGSPKRRRNRRRGASSPSASDDLPRRLRHAGNPLRRRGAVLSGPLEAFLARDRIDRGPRWPMPWQHPGARSMPSPRVRPFQQFGWIAAWLRTLGAAAGVQAQDRDGLGRRPAGRGVLPLCVRRYKGAAPPRVDRRRG